MNQGTIKTTAGELQKMSLLSYFLTYVGYMTLTISMSLTPYLAKGIALDSSYAQIAMSISFLMFSISAIAFATLSDIFTAKNVLIFTQSLSIFGLLTLALCQSMYFMYVGFVLLGLGTGCYSSISRALISRNAISNVEMKKSYAILSCCIIIAPVISAYVALMLIPISWRFAYVFMAGIELTLLIYSYSILKIDAKKQILIKPKNILDGFKHSFSQPRYIINVLMVSVMFSFYLGVLMSSFKGLFVDEIGVSIKYFSLLFLASSLIYILGVFSYRHKTSSTHKVKYNYGPLLILFVAILVYTVISLSISNVSITIYVICYILGFMIPLTTGAAMTNITKGHGSAAAFITFSVAFFMFVWEFARARLSISNYHFILLALWTTFIIVVLLKLLLIVIEKKMDKELKYK